jgi:hypothetical protein
MPVQKLMLLARAGSSADQEHLTDKSETGILAKR